MFSGKQLEPKIISLSSVGSGVGKDTVAEMLVEIYGYTQFSWTSELRRLVAKDFPNAPISYRASGVPHIQPDKEWETVVGFGNALRSYGKRVKILYRNMISLCALSRHKLNIVVSDTRFPMEAEFLRSHLGSKLVLVEGHARRGVFEFDELLSDLTWDYKLDNHGTMDELRKRVEVMVNEIY